MSILVAPVALYACIASLSLLYKKAPDSSTVLARKGIGSFVLYTPRFSPITQPFRNRAPVGKTSCPGASQKVAGDVAFSGHPFATDCFCSSQRSWCFLPQRCAPVRPERKNHLWRRAQKQIPSRNHRLRCRFLRLRQ